MKRRPVTTIKPVIKQAPVFNAVQNNSLSILQMNATQLFHHLEKIMKVNPYLHIHTVNVYRPEKEWYASSERSLQQDLIMQLHTMDYPISEEFATFMIQSLDENGFLTMTDEEYCRVLHLSSNSFHKKLQILQKLEPAGVFARNSLDSIRIQLEQDMQLFALQIFMNYQKELMERNYTKIAEQLQASMEDIKLAVAVIQEQNPYPCAGYGSFADIIYPDIAIHVNDNRLQIRPVNTLEGNFADHTAEIMNDPLLKDYFHQSQLIIEDIHRRNHTLLLVANELCKIQKAFFLKGESLVQCRLRDIAENLGIHTSTVSRCLKNKYYVFQNHIYPLRQLLLTSTVNDAKNPIVNVIKKLISSEDKSFPYSDYELYLLLKKQNIAISRRTVTKYRNQLGIENAAVRKAMYKQENKEFDSHK